MKKLNGKTAVITGGNSGIGYATAELFLREGAHVIITGRRADALNEAVRKLGAGSTGILSDAGNMADVRKLPQEIKKHTASVDIVFANAGVAQFAPFGDTSEELFDNTLDINFKSVFFTIQGLLPFMNDGGAIILNSTILVHSGLETSAIYSASKGAILSLGKTLAIELASRNIRVKVLVPDQLVHQSIQKWECQKKF